MSWSIEGSLLNQVSAEIIGNMMIRLIIIMMMFFWIRCFRVSPNLKFYLLLFIFYRDYFRAYSSFRHNSFHFISISSITLSGTLLFFKGWSLKVWIILSTMFVTSKVFILSAFFFRAALSEFLVSLDLFFPSMKGTCRMLSLLCEIELF